MKKILLILLSCLLIVFMAESAMAEINLGSTTVVVSPGQSVEIPVSVTNIGAGTYNYSLEVSQATDAIQAQIVNSEPSGLLNLGPATFIQHLVYNSNLNLQGQPVNATLKISRNENSGVGTVIVKITNQGQVETGYILVADTVIAEAPEFPTVAAPVAAVLGLLFVFGRKREGL
jgi:hypothetical protein